MIHYIKNFLKIYNLKSILYILFNKITFFPPFLLIISKNIYILSENKFIYNKNTFIQTNIELLFKTIYT